MLSDVYRGSLYAMNLLIAVKYEVMKRPYIMVSYAV